MAAVRTIRPARVFFRVLIRERFPFAVYLVAAWYAVVGDGSNRQHGRANDTGHRRFAAQASDVELELTSSRRPPPIH